MALAGCNTFSVGIFSWVTYEPEEGHFHFDWLDRIMDRMAEAGNKVFLATPSGAKPAWLSRAYPEVCRVLKNGLREQHHERHNHCYTSPIFREKTALLDGMLAERYAKHPALGGWHLSNEYGGCCYCERCFAAFRAWLQAKYGSLQALNLAWWSAFWSHTFTSWELIDPRDVSLDGMALDWNRFVTAQTVDFMAVEKSAVRAFSDAPVTTNMMGAYDGLDYWRIAELCDVIADDSYPRFLHPRDNADTLAAVGMLHDMHRAMKQGAPFVLMESCPSATCGMPLQKVKRPGMHAMEMLQAIGHGAEATMYFQWRKGQGGMEKFHGAVVDHAGGEHTRVFQDVAHWGATLRQLTPVLGTSVAPEVALIYDWEVRWALESSCGPSNELKQYVDTCLRHYLPCWRAGIPVDVIESLSDFSRYRLLIAPMLFLLKPGVASRLRAFVEQGGTLVLTYLSGIVDDTNRCFRHGWPGDGLRTLCGIWAEELDSIAQTDHQQLRLHATLTGDNTTTQISGNFPTHELTGSQQNDTSHPTKNQENPISTQTNPTPAFAGTYRVIDYCTLIHAEHAEVLATYTEDFYAGRPALTYHPTGAGGTYYLAARTEDRFLADFYPALFARHNIRSPFPGALPEGVTAQMRTDGATTFFFLLNATADEKEVPAPGLTLLATGEPAQNPVHLGPWGTAVLVTPP